MQCLSEWLSTQCALILDHYAYMHNCDNTGEVWELFAYIARSYGLPHNAYSTILWTCSAFKTCMCNCVHVLYDNAPIASRACTYTVMNWKSAYVAPLGIYKLIWESGIIIYRSQRLLGCCIYGMMGELSDNAMDVKGTCINSRHCIQATIAVYTG